MTFHNSCSIYIIPENLVSISNYLFFTYKKSLHQSDYNTIATVLQSNDPITVHPSNYILNSHKK